MFLLFAKMIEGIQEILCCPVCKSNLTKNLACTQCERKFTNKNGIYIMLDTEISRKEWKWNPTLFTEAKMTRMKEKYNSYINDETKNAQKIWYSKMESYLTDAHGVLVDIATGLGGLVENLMKVKNDFFPIITDVDPNVLFWTIKHIRNFYRRKVLGVATDAKYLCFKNSAVDYVVSCSGFNNIPQVILAFQEIYRILKKNSKLVFMHSYYDKNSPSAVLAHQFNMGAYTQENIITMLKQTSFKNIRSEIVASALWAKNPMDILPVAGDKQYFAVVCAKK